MFHHTSTMRTLQKIGGSLNALSFAMLEALLELTQMLLITLTLKE